MFSCASWIELDCYKHYASEYCSPFDAIQLVKHVDNVINFYNGTICKVIPFKKWWTSCNKKNYQLESKRFLKNINEQQPDRRSPFIEIPSADSLEASCINKLMIYTQYNMNATCLSASLDVWDRERRRLMDSYIWETCCAMYDALQCIQTYSNLVCNDMERVAIEKYRIMSEAAFTQGVCRTIPSDQASQLCRGFAFNNKPTIFLFFISSLFAILINI